MNARIKPLITTLGIAVLSFSSTAFAEGSTQTNSSATSEASAGNASTAQDKKMNVLISKINQQINEQEKTIAELKAEVRNLKSEQKTTEQIAKTAEKKSTAAAQSSIDARQVATKTQEKNARLISLDSSPVITAPYLGVPSRWDAFDLIVNQPTYDEDVLLMKRDYAIDKAAVDRGFTLPNNPVLELSGKVEAQGYQTKPFDSSQQSNIDVSAAEIDFVAHISKWVNGLMDVNYDNAAPNAFNGTADAELIANSRTYVSQAFLTVGNLAELPVYGTIGLRSIPYGHYSTYMVSDPYTKTMFRIKAPALAIGYQPMIGQLGAYAVGFLFKGDTGVGSTPTKVNNYGADLGYLFKGSSVSGDVGLSAVANIADSLGMQANGLSGGTQFEGFGFAPGSMPAEILNHRVPGVNAHLELDVDQFTLYAEGNMATTHFAPQDMSFNGQGAKPAAAHLEGVYNFNISKYPSFIALGFDQSWQALALATPQTRYISTFGISLFKDTIEDLEFKHELNYSSSDTASGQNLAVNLPGHVSNTLTAQIGYYF